MGTLERWLLSPAKGQTRGYRAPISERFWAKVIVRGPDECWVWQGARVRGRYGVVGRGGKYGSNCYAHRLSFELAFGAVPVGLSVLHRCDNPPCVNPAHLFLGTQADNIRDMDLKGRRRTLARKGQQHVRAKLTDEAVLEMRRARAEGERVASIARRFGVGWTAAEYATSGKTWRHLS